MPRNKPTLVFYLQEELLSFSHWKDISSCDRSLMVSEFNEPTRRVARTLSSQESFLSLEPSARALHPLSRSAAQRESQRPDDSRQENHGAKVPWSLAGRAEHRLQLFLRVLQRSSGSSP